MSNKNKFDVQSLYVKSLYEKYGISSSASGAGNTGKDANPGTQPGQNSRPTINTQSQAPNSSEGPISSGLGVNGRTSGLCTSYGPRVILTASEYLGSPSEIQPRRPGQAFGQVGNAG